MQNMSRGDKANQQLSDSKEGRSSRMANQPSPDDKASDNGTGVEQTYLTVPILLHSDIKGPMAMCVNCPVLNWNTFKQSVQDVLGEMPSHLFLRHDYDDQASSESKPPMPLLSTNALNSSLQKALQVDPECPTPVKVVAVCRPRHFASEPSFGGLPRTVRRLDDGACIKVDVKALPQALKEVLNLYGVKAVCWKLMEQTYPHYKGMFIGVLPSLTFHQTMRLREHMDLMKLCLGPQPLNGWNQDEEATSNRIIEVHEFTEMSKDEAHTVKQALETLWPREVCAEVKRHFGVEVPMFASPMVYPGAPQPKVRNPDIKRPTYEHNIPHKRYIIVFYVAQLLWCEMVKNHQDNRTQPSNSSTRSNSVEFAKAQTSKLNAFINGINVDQGEVKDVPALIRSLIEWLADTKKRAPRNKGLFNWSPPFTPTDDELETCACHAAVLAETYVPRLSMIASAAGN